MASQDIVTQVGAEYNQASFIGGMNLLGDDSRLQSNQYRAGFDLTNRYDVLDGVLESQEDLAAPFGLKQEMTTLGGYQILFVQGRAYYKYFTDTGWTQIIGFQMSPSAPRLWSCQVPVATTNYVRFAASGSIVQVSAGPPPIYLTDASGAVETANIAGALSGNVPGLVVQDNINQPQFIYIDKTTSKPTFRVTQKFTEWMISYTDATNTVVGTPGTPDSTQDKREYVPIGNSMAWNNGILFITSQDGNFIYRSVLGRALDFVVNVTNLLSTSPIQTTYTYKDPITGIVSTPNVPPFTQVGGGDATTTSYSVGVGGIACLRPLATGGIFVAASNANYAVTLNQTPNAPTIFGEYTFNRTFLFNANCISDRAILDTVGDTRFVDLTGVRSFNAVMQTQNEGRNVPFTSNIQAAFTTLVNGVPTNIVQDPNNVAAILYDNYELYAMETVFGAAIVKYDTVNNCWTSFDLSQTGGKRIKIFCKIELAVQRLYAITEDNRLFALYIGPKQSQASFRTIGVCATILYANTNLKMNNPRIETKLGRTRVILNKITQDGSCSFIPYINNRITSTLPDPHNITYVDPPNPSTDPNKLPDVDTQMENMLFSTPNCEQGWKVFGVFSWTVGSFTQFSMELEEITPMNPLNTQATTT